MEARDATIRRKWPLRASQLVLTLALLWIAFQRARPARDPTYQGKRLSRYLASFQPAAIARPCGGVTGDLPLLIGTFSDPLAVEAISALGTNALDFILQRLRSRSYNTTVDRWLQHQVRIGRWPRFLVRRPPEMAFSYQVQALGAIRVLGPRARPILPTLIELLADPELSTRAAMAFVYLQSNRPEDILALTNAFRLPRSGRIGAGMLDPWLVPTDMIGSFGTNAFATWPALLSNLPSDASPLAQATATALGRVGAPADQAVPAIVAVLERALPDTNIIFETHAVLSSRMQRLPSAIRALGSYGSAAQSGLPVLEIYKLHPAEAIRAAALEAIRNIRNDPFPLE